MHDYRGARKKSSRHQKLGGQSKRKYLDWSWKLRGWNWGQEMDWTWDLEEFEVDDWKKIIKELRKVIQEFKSNQICLHIGNDGALKYGLDQWRYMAEKIWMRSISGCSKQRISKEINALSVISSWFRATLARISAARIPFRLQMLPHTFSQMQQPSHRQCTTCISMHKHRDVICIML